MDYQQARYSEHALFEMARRQISEDEVREVLGAPGQVVGAGGNRVVLQSLSPPDDRERQYVLRVFVDVGISPPVVVTAYRPSKIAKHWSYA